MKKSLLTLTASIFLAITATANESIMVSPFLWYEGVYKDTLLMFRFNEKCYPSITATSTTAKTDGGKVSYPSVESASLAFDTYTVYIFCSELLKIGTNFVCSLKQDDNTESFSIRKISDAWEWKRDGDSEWSEIFDVGAGAKIESIVFGKPQKRHLYGEEGEIDTSADLEENDIITISIAPNYCINAKYEYQVQTSTNLTDWVSCRKRMRRGTRFYRVVRVNTGKWDTLYSPQAPAGEYDPNGKPITVKFNIIGNDFRIFYNYSDWLFLEDDDTAKPSILPSSSAYWGF